MTSRFWLFMALGGMEVCYLWAALALLNGWAASGQLHPLWLMPLYAVGAGLSWVLRRFRRPLRYPAAVAGTALALLLAIYVHFYTAQPLQDTAWLGSLLTAFNPVTAPGFPTQGVLLGMGLVLVWRGWVLAHTHPDTSGCLAQFQMGAAMFLLVFLAASQTGIAVEPWLPAVLVFIALSLWGLGLVRSREGKEWGADRSAWGGVLAATIALVLLAGGAVAVWLTPEVLQWPLRGLKALGALLMAIVDWLMGLLPAPEVSEVPEGAPPMDVLAAEAEATRMFALPEWLRRLLRGGLVVLMLGLVLAAIASVSAQVWGRVRRGLAGDAEPIPGGFRADLLSWLRGLKARLLRAILRRGGAPPEGPLTTPRQIYRSLLRAGARAGWPRLPHQTPLEYRATLTTTLTTGHDDLTAITATYVQARYGLHCLAPSPEEERQLSESWHRLRQLLKRSRLQRSPLSPIMGHEASNQ